MVDSSRVAKMEQRDRGFTGSCPLCRERGDMIELMYVGSRAFDPKIDADLLREYELIRGGTRTNPSTVIVMHFQCPTCRAKFDHLDHPDTEVNSY